VANRDYNAHARAVIDANLYMVLGTADEEGRPWVSPVYFAHDGYQRFLWVSRPEATHSRNLARRSEVAIVIFDSQVPVGGAQAVYMSATAEQLAGEERERGIAVFSERSQRTGAGEWSLKDVEPPAPLRLYRAIAFAQYVLGEGDRRVPVIP
jgi:nitroimidazol reductase NimA-like FMN-containing flavoprotein (pyridoxamine 5'-phosphate oxidase superfamily)